MTKEKVFEKMDQGPATPAYLVDKATFLGLWRIMAPKVKQFYKKFLGKTDPLTLSGFLVYKGYPVILYFKDRTKRVKLK